MSTFSYTAVDLKNSYLKGKIEARNSKTAVVQLEREGFMVVNVREEKSERFSKINNILTPVSTQDKIFFTRNLFTMLESGIALDQAIKITAEQTTNHKFKEVLTDIFERVQKGQSFHAALSQHPKYFQNFFVSLVRVGEKSGRLDEVLSYLLEKQEKDYDLMTKARGAMLYPSIIVTALILMVTLMLVFVIPKITGVLSQYDVDLPIATKILIGLSSFLLHYGIFLVPVVIAVILALRAWIKTPRGKWRWDAFVLKLPRINVIVKEFNLARFARSMSALLKSGVSLDQALDLASSVTDNSHYQKTVKGGITFIQKGIPVSEILNAHPKLYPPLTSRMIEVGERTGKLDHMLTRLAVFYEKSVETSLSNLSTVIEPVLLLSIGVTVGFVAIAVLTPIWKFSQTI